MFQYFSQPPRYSVHSSHLAACVVVEALPDAKQDGEVSTVFFDDFTVTRVD
jgi:hypothetical protein